MIIILSNTITDIQNLKTPSTHNYKYIYIYIYKQQQRLIPLGGVDIYIYMQKIKNQKFHYPISVDPTKKRN